MSEVLPLRSGTDTAIYMMTEEELENVRFNLESVPLTDGSSTLEDTDNLSITIHGPALPSDDQDQLYDNWGGDLAPEDEEYFAGRQGNQVTAQKVSMVLDEQLSDGLVSDEDYDSENEGWVRPTQGAYPVTLGKISGSGGERIARTVTEDLPTPFAGTREDAYTVQQQRESNAELCLNAEITTDMGHRYYSTCTGYHRQSVRGGSVLALAMAK